MHTVHVYICRRNDFNASLILQHPPSTRNNILKRNSSSWDGTMGKVIITFFCYWIVDYFQVAFKLSSQDLPSRLSK